MTWEPPRCAWHEPNPLGYVQWHEDAMRRAKAGEKQRQCPHCGLWFWEDEYGVPPQERPA